MPLDAKLFAYAVRCHWHVENRLMPQPGPGADRAAAVTINSPADLTSSADAAG
jgi:hypothetical protein